MYFYMKYNYYYFFIQCGTMFSRHFSLYNFFIFLSIINSGWCIVKPKLSSLQRHQNCVRSTLKSETVIDMQDILYLVLFF